MCSRVRVLDERGTPEEDLCLVQIGENLSAYCLVMF